MSTPASAVEAAADALDESPLFLIQRGAIGREDVEVALAAAAPHLIAAATATHGGRIATAIEANCAMDGGTYHNKGTGLCPGCADAARIARETP